MENASLMLPVVETVVHSAPWDHSNHQSTTHAKSASPIVEAATQKLPAKFVEKDFTTQTTTAFPVHKELYIALTHQQACYASLVMSSKQFPLTQAK